MDVILAAKRRLAEIIQAQAALAAEQSELENFIALSELMERKLGKGDAARDHGQAAAQDTNAASRIVRRQYFATTVFSERNNSRQIAALCQHVLMRMGRPMRPAELLKYLEQLGVVVYGKNPSNSLSAILSGIKDTFESTPSGWQLVRMARHAGMPGPHSAESIARETSTGFDGPMHSPTNSAWAMRESRVGLKEHVFARVLGHEDHEHD